MPTLHWIGKDKVVKHHHDVPFRVLNHQYTFPNTQVGDSISENKIIHGDNLEALKALLPYYEGKIKCIYIDPPYNTGNEGWVYNDNVNDPKMKKWLGKVVGKEAEDLTRHDKWLCMMYPRLKLLHKLLAPDGAIFVSIDDNEGFSLKLMMDEIWGGGNFISEIACINNPKGRSDDKYVATAHEIILIYRRSDKFKMGGFKAEDKITKRYNKEDVNGKKFREIDLRKTGDSDLRKDRPNMFYPFIYNLKSKELKPINLDSEIPNGFIEILPMKNSLEEGRWRWKIETSRELIESLIPKYMPSKKQWTVFEKDFFEENDKIKPTSIWDFKDVNSERGTEEFIKKLGFQKGDFPNPKPVGTIERILQIATHENSIILDSFAGSGTTAQAVLNLNKADGGNRKFILVEMEDYAETITAERVKRVIKGYKVSPTGGDLEGATGGDFSYYELGESLFDEDRNLNENLPVATLRDYIWYAETKRPLPETSDRPEGGTIKENKRYFLNKYQETAYFFIYEKERITTLDYDFLEHVNIQAEQYVMYADNCTLSEAFRREKHIIFKKIPRDISRF